MTHRSRGQRLNAAFVTVADTLGSDYNSDELMHTLLEECTAVLDVHDGGVVLSDASGALRLIAATSEQAWAVELAQLGALSGPALECFTSGEPVAIPDLGQTAGRWPEFEQACRERGFHSVYALPMRLREQIVGTMSLYGTTRDALDPDGMTIGQALADVATIGILHEREIRASARMAELLERSLTTRILVEQAKGMLVGTGAGSVDEAHGILRRYAAGNSLTLREVAEAVIARRLLLSDSGLTTAPAA